MGNTASMFGFSVPDAAANAHDIGMLKYQGDQQRQAAEDANRFTERMSNTSWQRGVADMRAAGINPMLAFSQGGASAPSGVASQVPDYSRLTGSSAVGYDANYNAARAQTQANTALANANTMALLGTSAPAKQQMEFVNQSMKELVARTKLGATNAEREAQKLHAEEWLNKNGRYRQYEAMGKLGVAGQGGMLGTAMGDWLMGN